MAYTQRSGRCDRKVVEVQLLSWAQKLQLEYFYPSRHPEQSVCHPELAKDPIKIG